MCTQLFRSCLTLCESHGLWPARLLSPWDPPGKSPRVGCPYCSIVDLQCVLLSSVNLLYIYTLISKVYQSSGSMYLQVAQAVKNLPSMQQSQVPSLGWEDPLEKTMATHTSSLAWRIP